MRTNAARSLKVPSDPTGTYEGRCRCVASVGRTSVQRVNDKLVWIDCEMTGLSLETDALVEVAALVTDYDLNVLGDGIDLIVKPPQAALEQMNDFVREMHTSSGLLTKLDGGLSLRDTEEQVLAYVREFVKEPGKAPMAGNTMM